MFRFFYKILYLIIVAIFTTSSFPVTALATRSSEGITFQRFKKSPYQTSFRQTNDTLEVDIDEEIDLDKFHPNGSLVLHFNQPMDPDSADTALLTYPYVPGIASWDNTNTTLIFSPENILTPGETYTFFLDRDLKSSRGTLFAQTQFWQAHVVEGPTINTRKPSSNNIPRRAQIELTFDRAMDIDSVAQAFNVQPPVAKTLSWRENTLMITPDKPLEPGKRYSFTITSSAKDTDGVPMAEDYRWEYWLPAFDINTSGPTRMVNQVWLDFSYAIDTMNTGLPFAIEPPVIGDWRWVNSKKAQFTFSEPLSYGLTYTVVITEPLIDSNGDVLPIPETPLFFAAPPPIEQVTPEPDSDVFADEIQIKVDFDIPMDRTATQAAFHIDPPISGSFEWENNTMFFIPEADLDEYTTYLVTIEPTAIDAQGNPVLTTPYSWSFSTNYGSFDYGEGNTAFSIYGYNIQIVDTDGRRAIQFQLDKDDNAVDFSLYQFELGSFVNIYKDSYASRSWGQSLPIDIGDSEPMISWRQFYNSGGVQELIIPDEVPQGLYVLDMNTGGELVDQLFVVLTRYTLVIKQSGDELFVWATDINDQALEEVEIRLYSTRGEKIRQGNTNKDGVYLTTIPEGYTPLLVAARGEDGDASIAGLSRGWNSSVPNWWQMNRGAGKANYTAYIYTDRPIYRPGHTVYFKAVLREDQDVKYYLPPIDAPVTARIHDARGNIIQTYNLSTNQFGTVNGEFLLASGAMLGEYEVEIIFEGGSYWQTFSVQDYRKPDFKIDITTDADKYVAGDTITADIDISYFFGEAVPNANLTIKRYYLIEKYWWWRWWGDSEIEPEYTWYETYNGISYATTDSDGHYSYSFNAPEGDEWSCITSWLSSLMECAYGLEITVDDGSHQVVSNSIIYKVYNAGEDITFDLGGYLKRPGVPFNINALVTDLNGVPVANRALRLDITRWSQESHSDIPVASYNLTTGEDGQSGQSISLDQPGYYELVLSSADLKGNDISFKRWVYMFSDTQTWASRYAEEIKISAEYDSYRPYETARFLIESTFSGPALLTFERGSIIHYKPIELTAPLTIIDLEMIPEYAPNVFVTVNAWQFQNTTLPDPDNEEYYWYSTNLPDSRLRVSSVEVDVEVVAKELNVIISPDKDVYAPREDATFTIKVTDWQGAPVSAEVSLAMVDEAIFSLSTERSGPIFSGFYGKRGLSVMTYDSMSPYRLIYGGNGRGGGGDGDLQANPRSDFPDTAIWLPALYTDANGEIVVNITLPDNLTSWRLTARALTVNTRVGEAIINITTQKEVIVRPILPRSLTAGDRVEMTALVHNYGENTRDIVVALLPTPFLEITEPITQTITVEPGNIHIASWMVTALSAGETEVLISADAGDNINDAVLLPLTIRPLAIPDVHTQVGNFSNEFVTTLVIPDNALEMSQVEIRLNRSIAGSLIDGLEYLTGYPYGCVEQTMSRALPNAVVGRALFQLGFSNPVLEAELPGLINAGLQKLYGLQHNDGGWGWWYDDSTHDYQTAWVVFGLALTAEAGHEVDPLVIERGVDWLSENIEDMDMRTRAYALYSMALTGLGNLGETQFMAERIHELDTFSQAALALALYKLGDIDGALAIIPILAETALQRDNLVYWPQPREDGHYYEKTMASTTRSTAIALDAFIQIAPDHAFIPGIVQYLMRERKTYGWGSTNETAFAIIALTDHLLSLTSTTTETGFVIKLNENEILSGSLGPGAPLSKQIIPYDLIDPGANLLSITTDQDTQLYYTIISRVFLPQEQIEASGNIQITREYIDLTTKKPAEAVIVGDLVKIKLTITIPDGASFIIVEDLLPGGYEALNESLNTTSHEGVSKECAEYEYYESCWPHYYWEDYGYNNKDVHGDRVTFFITEFNAGTLTLSYLARATHSGIFIAMPAEVYAMYDATLWGRSDSTMIEVSR